MLYNPYNMEKLFEYASEYAKGYADVGYDEDQIASVRDAFIDGAKWQRNNIWHEPDEKPYNKDKRLTLEALRRPLLCAFEDHFAIYLAEDLHILAGVKKWAYVDELIPFELEQL